MFKIIALVLLSLLFLFRLFLNIRSFLARKKPIPEEVKDVYDEERYLKWQAYSNDKLKASIVFSTISFVVTFVLIILDVYSLVCKGVSISYLSALIVLGIYVGVGLIIDIISDYVMKIKIDGKYGFNKATGKTFVGDCIRKTIITVILYAGLTCLFIALYQAMGDYILIVFSAIIFVLLLLIKVLFPFLSKASNRFASLEEGPLRDRLIALLTKYGYEVRDIKVMDASRRTTKSNAYFTGSGKTKTIVLYDNMLKALSEDEIVAVFAHELAHGLHKDSLKRTPLSFLGIVILVVLAWLLVKTPQIFVDFGFSGVNYGFAVVLLIEVVAAVIMTFFNIPLLIVSRRCEYKADELANKEGYGEQLISGLKKLYKDDLGDLNPDPLVVALTYSHPTLYQRIKNIRKDK